MKLKLELQFQICLLVMWMLLLMIDAHKYSYHPECGESPTKKYKDLAKAIGMFIFRPKYIESKLRNMFYSKYTYQLYRLGLVSAH